VLDARAKAWSALQLVMHWYRGHSLLVGLSALSKLQMTRELSITVHMTPVRVSCYTFIAMPSMEPSSAVASTTTAGVHQ
jgi:hypothetical protein